MAENKDRSSWSARTAFWSAAIGSAVGLGNIWRFPSLCYQFGGGAFLLPFVLGIVFVGLPILTLEFGLGQIFRSGDVHSFGSINKRLSGIGVGSVICGFMVTCYYVIILAWAAIYFTQAFKRVSTEDGTPQFVWTAHDGGAAGYLWGEVIGVGAMTDMETIAVGNATIEMPGNLNRSMQFVPHTFGALTVLWILIYASIFKGPKATGRLTYVTMGLPFVLIIIFAIYFGSMEGASDGVAQYFSFDFTKLAGDEPCGGRACSEAWPAAVSQVFFSLSITFGVMTAYASYCPKDQGIMSNAAIVAFSDFGISIVSGFCVFTAVGTLALAQGKAASEIAGDAKSFGLVFVTYPAAIEELDIPFAARQTLAILWFGTIVMLGIDSAFSLVEGFVTSFKDARLFKDWSRESMTFIVCLVGYIIGMEYATDTGIYSLDAIDHYINISMLFVGFMECVTAGWMYMYAEHTAKIGPAAWWMALGSMVFASYYGPRAGLGYGGAEGTAFGLCTGFFIFGAGMVLAARRAAQFQGKSLSMEVIQDVLFWNIEELRGIFNKHAGRPAGNLPIPFVWSVLIKFLIPPILMLLLIIEFKSKTFGVYEGYHTWYQGWGIFLAALPWAATAINFVLPDIFDPLKPDDGSQSAVAAPVMLGRTSGDEFPCEHGKI